MTLSEAVKTIKDYCSKTRCEDCVFGFLYKNEWSVWLCELDDTPREWKVPSETTIKKEA